MQNTELQNQPLLTQKKTWQKPEVYLLDSADIESGPTQGTVEGHNGAGNTNAKYHS